MRILYVLPHPDDESFGPAAVIHKYITEGHEVHLLTLTRGGATKMRYKLNYSVAEMGEVRFKEMLNVEKTLNLSSMTVLDMPDSGLKDIDPREIEKVVYDYTERINPDILCTYPVHGISGFYDHLVCHAAVLRVFLELKEKDNNLKRLALFGVTAKDAEKNTRFPLKSFKDEEIDCVIGLSAENVAMAHKALDCYVTYKEVIDESRVKETFTKEAPFEFFGESFSPPVTDIFEKLIKK